MQLFEFHICDRVFLDSACKGVIGAIRVQADDSALLVMQGSDIATEPATILWRLIEGRCNPLTVLNARPVEAQAPMLPIPSPAELNLSREIQSIVNELPAIMEPKQIESTAMPVLLDELRLRIHAMQLRMEAAERENEAMKKKLR